MARITDLSAELHGINQSASLEESLKVAEEYLKNDCDVQIRIHKFGKNSDEHSEIEYEVWAYINANDWENILKSHGDD